MCSGPPKPLHPGYQGRSIVSTAIIELHKAIRPGHYTNPEKMGKVHTTGLGHRPTNFRGP